MYVPLALFFSVCCCVQVQFLFFNLCRIINFLKTRLDISPESSFKSISFIIVVSWFKIYVSSRKMIIIFTVSAAKEIALYHSTKKSFLCNIRHWLFVWHVEAYHPRKLNVSSNEKTLKKIIINQFAMTWQDDIWLLIVHKYMT